MTGHPPQNCLAEYAQGKMCDEALIEWVEAHLADCDDCRLAVEDAPRDDIMLLVRDSAAIAAQVPSDDARISDYAAAFGHKQAGQQNPRRPFRLIAGYEILNELDRGGMGVVFRARQIGLNRIVALKRLHSGVLASGDELRRFRQEAAALAALQHPNIVQVFDAGEQEGEPFLAMEFIDGQPLSSVLSKTTLSPDVAAKLVCILARGIQAAHQSGVIHRDLKPANVLIPFSTEVAADSDATSFVEHSADQQKQLSNRAKIVDFGLAKVNQPPDGMSNTRVWWGTPSYMAPEQAHELSPLSDVLSDVYGLGAILYECLVGRPPHLGATHLETLRQVRESEPIAPREFQSDLPLDLQSICLKCLRKQPSRRYLTAAALAEDLQRFLDGEPTKARPVGIAEHLLRWTKRRPAEFGLIAISLLALFGAFVAFLHHVADLHVEVEKTTTIAEQVESEQQRADRNYVGARETVQRLYTLVEDTWNSESPEVRELSERLLQPTTEFFQSIVDNGDQDLQSMYDLSMSRQWYGTLLLRNDKVNESREQYRRSIAAATVLRQRAPDSDIYRFHEAAVQVDYGQALAESPADLKKSAEQIMSAIRTLTVMPEKTSARLRLEALAKAYRSLAITYKAADRQVDAEAVLRKAIKIQSQLIKLNTKNVNLEIDTAQVPPTNRTSKSPF
ncbi:MAG: serine/threonine protein kinase [Planctomycetaceae bacterium]|nr:serine/threonine protein kinase [Planctomycetaceae bacterium]